MDRHPDIAWGTVEARLKADPEEIASLNEMEKSGGEPDVVDRDSETGAIVFFDCQAESPAGRRKCCYDRAGLESRKAHQYITKKPIAAVCAEKDSEPTEGHGLKEKKSV